MHLLYVDTSGSLSIVVNKVWVFMLVSVCVLVCVGVCVQINTTRKLSQLMPVCVSWHYKSDDSHDIFSYFSNI